MRSTIKAISVSIHALSAADAVRPIRKMLSVAERGFGVLVDSYDQRLNVLIAVALVRLRGNSSKPWRPEDDQQPLALLKLRLLGRSLPPLSNVACWSTNTELGNSGSAYRRTRSKARPHRAHLEGTLSRVRPCRPVCGPPSPILLTHRARLFSIERNVEFRPTNGPMRAERPVHRHVTRSYYGHRAKLGQYGTAPQDCSMFTYVSDSYLPCNLRSPREGDQGHE